jgi:hypothetical protein
LVIVITSFGCCDIVAYSAYDEGGYSPRLWKKSDLGDEVEIIDFEADEKERSDQRERILKGDKVELVIM